MALSQTVIKQENTETNDWTCNICTFKNNVALNHCEMCDCERYQNVSDNNNNNNGNNNTHNARENINTQSLTTIPETTEQFNGKPCAGIEIVDLTNELDTDDDCNDSQMSQTNYDDFQSKFQSNKLTQLQSSQTISSQRSNNNNNNNDRDNSSVVAEPALSQCEVSKWRCVVCTFDENESFQMTCQMCGGPSQLQTDLFGKRICTHCTYVNDTNHNNCQECSKQLTHMVQYNDICQLQSIPHLCKGQSMSENEQQSLNQKFGLFTNKNNNQNKNFAAFNQQMGMHPQSIAYNYSKKNNNNAWAPPPQNQYNNNNNNNYAMDDNAIMPYKHNIDYNHYINSVNPHNINQYHPSSIPGGYYSQPAFSNASKSKAHASTVANKIFGQLGNAFGSNGFSWNGKMHNGLPQMNKKQQKENNIERADVKKEYENAMKTGKTVRCKLIRRRSFVENDEGDSHFRRCESQFMRSCQRNLQFQNMNNNNAGLFSFGNQANNAGNQALNKTIKEVIYVINPKLITKFENKKKELMKKHGFANESDVNTVLAWHGTPHTNINSIVSNNFNLSMLASNSGDQGWYGQGIYFSEFASVSASYGDGLLLCKVILGKSFKMHSNDQQTGRHKQDGFDSHLVVKQDQSQYGQEIVIFDVDQILPCYIVRC